MSLIDLTFFAQQDPAALPEATTGQMLAGLLLLMVIVGSVSTIAVWVRRSLTTGHALPVANRGILRVPFALTAVGIGLAVLMMIMTLLIPLVDSRREAGAEAGASDGSAAESGAAQSESVVDDNLTTADKTTIEKNSDDSALADASAESSGEQTETEQSGTTEQTGSTSDRTSDAPTAPVPDLKKMRRLMLDNILFELILFLIFGVFVLLASRQGRASLEVSDLTTQDVAAGETYRSRTYAAQAMANDAWPGLDEETEVPDPPFGLPGAMVTPGAFATPASMATASTMGNSASEGMSEPLATEPFSLAKELRFAGEVFLAAYLPTTILRAIIVQLYIQTVGEDPGQHQLLEMLQRGADLTLMILIAATAVIFAPIVEELQFRVVMLGGLAQRGQVKMAFVMSSILFGLVHGLPDGLALMPLAFALGYTYLQRRSYITVILVHFIFNGFNMLLAMLLLV